ncbi:MAG: 4Fe-4S binding protein [Dehalococcoidales bacterium]|nr:4Fe-4S binding protein [Dehalococcoidales bacterium]
MAKSESELTCKDLEIGSIMVEPGNARQYKTGDWKSQKPILDKKKCTKCGLCFIYCPEGCIRPDAEGYFIPDLFYCKGCGICDIECPTKAIKMVEEEE